MMGQRTAASHCTQVAVLENAPHVIEVDHSKQELTIINDEEGVGSGGRHTAM